MSTRQGVRLLFETEAEDVAAYSSRYDLVVAADAGNLWRIKDAGLLQNVTTPTLSQGVPERLHDAERLLSRRDVTEIDLRDVRHPVRPVAERGAHRCGHFLVLASIASIGPGSRSVRRPRTVRSDMHGPGLSMLFADLLTGGGGATHVLLPSGANGTELVISQAAPTDCMVAPRFEARLAIQIARKAG